MRAYTVRTLVSCLVVTCWIFGCNSHPATPWVEKGRHRLWSFPLLRMTPDPTAGPLTRKALMDDSLDFVFVAGGIPGLDEFRVVHIDSEGKCEYRFPDYPTPQSFVRKGVSFQLTQEEMQSLRGCLAQSRCLEMARVYDAGGADGMIIRLKCSIGGREKMVECCNHFPDEIVQIYDYVKDNIIECHKSDIKNAKPTGSDSSGCEEFFPHLQYDQVKQQYEKEMREEKEKAGISE